MAEQPSGTISMLFTDVEGSTRLLHALGAERYGKLLERHHQVLRAAFVERDGFEMQCEGDSFFVVFASAQDAVAAAATAQRTLAGAAWPAGCEFRVRIGVHTGEPLLDGPRYVGLDVHRAARIMQAAHGGQVLVSQS